MSQGPAVGKQDKLLYPDVLYLLLQFVQLTVQGFAFSFGHLSFRHCLLQLPCQPGLSQHTFSQPSLQVMELDVTY